MPKRPKVPTLMIQGRKYLLSDYGGPLGSLADDEEQPLGGARLINVGGHRFRYLWVCDTEKGFLGMWRHSDGDDKLYERANSVAYHIHKLEGKGQLNRVDHQEMVKVERFMKQRADENLKALKEYAEEIASSFEKHSFKILQDWFDGNVRPNLERKLDEVARGLIPFGFRVNESLLDFKDKTDQARTFVVTKALEGFNQDKAYQVVSDALGIDAYEPPNGGIQDVQWAWSDVIDKVHEQYLR